MRKFDCNSSIRWPTTVTAKPKISRQKQHTSRQHQKPHGKTKVLTAIPNTSEQKPNTSRQKQILTAKPKLFCFCCEVFGFAVRFLVCRDVFVFAVRFLVLAWGILFLPWGFWVCREVFCFCREVFGFAVRYFVFAVRFLGLPWGFWVCREVFCFCREGLVLPWQLWATIPLE